MRRHNQIYQPRLVGYNNARFSPDESGEAGRGFVGIWSRFSHRQTVLGCQPLEQVVHGAFPISACSRVQHSQVCTPRLCDNDCHREGGRCGSELQG
jgi:hypothetical protein